MSSGALKIVETLRVVEAPPETTLAELTALLQFPLWWEGDSCHPLKDLAPFSAFGLDIRPFGPQAVAQRWKWVSGSWVKWVTIFGWVTWVMDHSQ